MISPEIRHIMRIGGLPRRTAESLFRVMDDDAKALFLAGTIEGKQRLAAILAIDEAKELLKVTTESDN